MDTVNPNSWQGAMRYLERTTADAVLIQEARKSGAQRQSAEREARRSGWNASVSEAEHTEADGVTGGLAVAVKRHIGLARLGGGDDEVDEDRSARIHVRWMGAAVRGGIHLVTAWPHHTEGPTPRNLDILDELARVIASIKGPWIIGADWNMTPATLAATGWLDFIDGIAIMPDGTTCQSSCIDFLWSQRASLMPSLVSPSFLMQGYILTNLFAYTSRRTPGP